MRDYIIITDSTTDLPMEYVKEKDINIVSLSFIIKNKTYKNTLDGQELGFKDFYNLMRSGEMVTTSQVNPLDIIEIYEPYLEKGIDILGIGFSSGLSGTFNSMRIAQEELKLKYPKRKILIIDSLCASMGEGLFVYYANKYLEEGKSIEQNYEALLSIRLHLCHWFTVSDIDLLRRGGRVSGTAAFMAKTININPVLHVDDDGHLIPKFKKIGRKSALKELVNQMLKTIDRSKKQMIFISHGDCLEDAEFVANLVRKEDFCEDIVINYVGPVIGAHSGPGTVALFFIGKHR